MSFVRFHEVQCGGFVGDMSSDAGDDVLHGIEKRASRCQMYKGDEWRAQLDTLEGNKELTSNAVVFLIECMLEEWKKNGQISPLRAHELFQFTEVKARRNQNRMTVEQAKKLIKEVEDKKKEEEPPKPDAASKPAQKPKEANKK